MCTSLYTILVKGNDARKAVYSTYSVTLLHNPILFSPSCFPSLNWESPSSPSSFVGGDQGCVTDSRFSPWRKTPVESKQTSGQPIARELSKKTSNFWWEIARKICCCVRVEKHMTNKHKQIHHCKWTSCIYLAAVVHEQLSPSRLRICLSLSSLYPLHLKTQTWLDFQRYAMPTLARSIHLTSSFELYIRITPPNPSNKQHPTTPSITLRVLGAQNETRLARGDSLENSTRI